MNQTLISPEEAIRRLRRDPASAALVRDAYVGEDLNACANAFAASAEFAEVLEFLGDRVRGANILDVGAGNGIASHAFAHSGAAKVFALEPDPSGEIGHAAIRRLVGGLPVQVMDTVAETIALPDASMDIVYARQVLHHITELPRALCEFARVLKPGGVFIACRDHVVDDERQLQEFLKNHPVHPMTGGEHAHSLDAYLGAIQAAGLRLVRVIKPWDSVINAYPAVRSAEELRGYPAAVLQRRFGKIGSMLSSIPFVQRLAWARLKRPTPGRLYSFFAEKA